MKTELLVPVGGLKNSCDGLLFLSATNLPWDGGLMLPEVLRPAPGEGISAGLGNPPVVNVPLGAPVGKDVEEAQELPP